MSLIKQITGILPEIHRRKPLVHHITNYVTVTDCANITLALGGSPVMADDAAEVEEMVSFASALVLNIGTLNTRTIESMLLAGKKAGSRSIPIVLDPVGVGATKLRTDTAAALIREVKPSIIRGNMSEIKLLAGLNVTIKGVDSAADEADARSVAAGLARRLGCIVAITGKQDVISDGERFCLIDNGHEWLARVTGTGCMATSLIGTCCGVTGDWFAGTAAGLAIMGIAGEMARASLGEQDGIGTFRTKIFDAVFRLSPETLLAQAKICEGEVTTD